jgi:hypothetical protein
MRGAAQRSPLLGFFRKAFGMQTNEPPLMKRNPGQEMSLDRISGVMPWLRARR